MWTFRAGVTRTSQPILYLQWNVVGSDINKLLRVIPEVTLLHPASFLSFFFSLLVKRQWRAYSPVASWGGVFPCRRFHPNPVFHLPRRLPGIPPLTSPPLNALFYRSLPFSPLATVSHRSIRDAGLPVVPVVWRSLMGGEEASIGYLLSFERWAPRAVPSYWRIWVAGNGDSDVAQSYCCTGAVWMDVSMTAAGTACWWGAMLDQRTIVWSDPHGGLVDGFSPLPIIFSLKQPHITCCFSPAQRVTFIAFSSHNFPIFTTLPHLPLSTDLHTSLAGTLHL